MAAILCRVFFVEPCRACGRCINEACKCCDSICDEIGKCCDYICDIFEKPFSMCLFLSIALNLGSLIYAVISLTGGTVSDDCDESSGTMDIYLILLILFTLLNSAFSYYIFFVMNSDEFRQYTDPRYAEQNPNAAQPAQSIGTKAWEFFQYNPYFAAYICCVFVPTIVIVSLAMGARCPDSTKSDGLYWSSTLIIIFIVIGVFILVSYIFIEAMKSASTECCWWLIPCAWPCLLIGVCANMLEENYGQHPPATKQDYRDQANRPVRGPKNQKKPTQQIAQPAPAQPVAQPLVAVAVVPVNPQPQANPFRPNYTTTGGPSAPPQANYQTNVQPSAPIQPYYTNQAPPQSSQPQVAAAPAQGQAAAGPGGPPEKTNTDVAMDVAKAGGALAVKGAKRGIGFMAKGLNKLNDKLNESNQKEGTGAAPPQQGREGEGQP